MSYSDDRIEIHFDVHEPVELVELTLAFQGLGRDYKRFLQDRARSDGKKINVEDVKLYITKIESNCILAELAGGSSILGAVYSVMDYQNIFTDYVRNFRDTINYFRGLAREKEVRAAEIQTTKAGAQAISDLMGVVAGKSRTGKFALRARAGSETPDGHKVYLEIELTSDEAAEAQRGALIAKKVLDYRGDADHPNVLLYFQQTSTDEPKASGRTADKAIIRSISSEALPVHFASGLDQALINDMKDDPNQNPFKAAFRVDVNVEVDRHDQPRYYRVLHIHEVLPDEGEE